MTTTTSPSETFRALLKARNPLLWVTSGEERRAERAIAAIAQRDHYRVIFWDCAGGASEVDGEAFPLDGPEGNPQSVYRAIRKRHERMREVPGANDGDTIETCRELWILRDLPDLLGNPLLVRGLKTLARDLQDEMDPNRIAAVVVLSPTSEIPPSLQSSALLLDWPLPPREEIGQILDQVIRAARLEPAGNRDKIIDAAAGLAADDIAGAFALSIIRHSRVDPVEVASQKRLIIAKEPTLQWWEPEPRGLDAIGGLDHLKTWLIERASTLTPEARAYGLPAPKGVLLIGVPGGGKSLTAKALATAWGLPLLRLDLGATKGSLVGESEQRIRRALKTATAMAPVAIWIDEVEKALAGSDSRGDGGVAADQLSTLLTWLQEHEGTVFVVATANNVHALPPEFTRRGRFDEIFFVDLPTRFERQQIIAVTLAKFNRDASAFDLAKIADATDGFSGAELAELVPSGMFTAFADDGRDLTTEDLLAAAEQQVPLSQSAKEQISELREWARGRARRASAPEITTPRRGGGVSAGYGRALDLGDATTDQPSTDGDDGEEN